MRNLVPAILALVTSGCISHSNDLCSHTYSINKPEIIKYLDSSGCAISEIANYWQDASGRALYIPAGDSVSGFRVYILTSTRTRPNLKFVQLPADDPLLQFWIDAKGNILYLPKFAFRDSDPAVFTQIDPQSGYFFQRQVGAGVVYVGDIHNSTGWLFTVQESEKFKVGRILARSETVYLLDERDELKYPFIIFRNNNCYVYSRDTSRTNKFSKVDEFRLDGRIKSADPFSSLLLCYSFGQGPFPRKPFLFDAKSHKELSCGLGNANNITLFLENDWISGRLNDN